MSDLLDNINNNAVFWLLVVLGVLLLIEIAVFAIMIIVRRNKTAERQLLSLTLDTSMVKREYEIGEQFDYSGLIATANYSDDPLDEIIDKFTIATPELLEQLKKDGKEPEDYEGCLIYLPDLTVEGKPTVTVTYHGVIASYAVAVVTERVSPVERVVVAAMEQPPVERKLIGITLNTDAVRKEYKLGEELDLTGLVVYANYNLEPFAEVVDSYTVLPVDMSVNLPTVMISYGGFVSSFSVTVTPVQEVIHITPEPIVIEEESVENVLRYDRSFTARLIQSEDELKNWYTELKNYILSYKKVKDRMSWKRETYRFGRDAVARLSYRGKTLCLYLPLNPNDYLESKYKVEDASDNTTYADTPCMYRLKNERRVKYAMELIDVVMERIGTTKIERESVDYYVPYEGVVELIDKGLIKRNIKSKQDEAFFEEKQAEAAATEESK
ncbi:MAG: hypothetical protein J1F36_03715 [Clostridiales bacterium]|nr:hypothetical protein [Clostridiales bacterium]